MDFDAALPQVESVFAGTFSGVVADAAADQAGDFEPCTDAGAAFTLVLDIGTPICDDPDDEAATCEKADSGSFPLSGALTLAEERALGGSISVWSEKDGLHPMFQTLEFVALDYPVENLSLVTAGDTTLLEDLVLTEVTWDRRISADSAATHVWEQCRLVLE